MTNVARRKVEKVSYSTQNVAKRNINANISSGNKEEYFYLGLLRKVKQSLVEVNSRKAGIDEI